MVTAPGFWSSKRRKARFDTVTFNHTEFAAPERLVFNVFAEVTLGGDVYMPVPGDIGEPQRNADGQPRLTITFPRAVVGRQFKQALRLVQAASSVDPITCVHAIWLEDMDVPKFTWPMFVNDKAGVRFDRDRVQVVATLDNPMTRAVAPIYDPGVFTGLRAT